MQQSTNTHLIHYFIRVQIVYIMLHLLIPAFDTIFPAKQDTYKTPALRLTEKFMFTIIYDSRLVLAGYSMLFDKLETCSECHLVTSDQLGEDNWGPFLASWPAKPFSTSSVSKNREVYMPETSCMMGTSVHFESMWIKQLCNYKTSGPSRNEPVRNTLVTLHHPVPNVVTSLPNGRR